MTYEHDYREELYVTVAKAKGLQESAFFWGFFFGASSVAIFLVSLLYLV